MAETNYKARMQGIYEGKIVKAMTEKFGYTNALQVPRIEKIVINMGVGEATQDKKKVDIAAGEMQQIAGQKPVIIKAKKSVAQFKLREGMPIGCSVTLRGIRMWEFMDRFVSIALPRVRDFRGAPTKSFDGRGNYTMGIRDHLIFQEIDMNKVERPKGMNITFVTTAENDEQALHLLRGLGVPFARN